MIRAFSYGGGVQSTAALVLAAQHAIDFPLFLFANVGDDSENPATLRYMRDVALPYAQEHGIELIELTKDETLLQRVRRSPRSIPIPMRMSDSGATGTRQCTQRFKIAVVAAELKRRGARIEAPAVLGLGISLDEFHRARSSSPVPIETLAYPLIERRMDRQDCINVIVRAGIPVPEKSSCWFCPFHTLGYWRNLLRTDPAVFEAAATLEDEQNAKRAAMDKDPVYLTSRLRPLREAVRESGQMDLFEGGCDIAGYCHV